MHVLGEAVRQHPATRAREGGILGFVALSFALSWIALLLWAYSPGVLSPDSIEQWRQGRLGVYDNWHPPLIAAMYWLCSRSVGSPWPLLALQLAGLGLGMAAIAMAAPARARWRAVLLLPVLLSTPTVWALAVMLWKDVLMASALVVAVAALRWRRPLASLAALVLAVTCRHNALIAAIPLVPLVILGLLPGRRARTRFAATLATLALLAVIPKIVDATLHARERWLGGSLLIFDLGGIYSQRPEAFEGSTLEHWLTHREVRELYSPWSVNALIMSDRGRRSVDFEHVTEFKAQLVREWMEQVSRHFGPYLRHRLESWRLLMSLGVGSNYAFQSETTPNPFGFHTNTGSPAHRLTSRLAAAAHPTLLFRGWLWLGGCLLVIAISAFSGRRSPLAIATAASGDLYALSYLLVGVAADFRYLYWTVVAAMVSALLLASEAPAPTPSRGRSNQAGTSR